MSLDEYLAAGHKTAETLAGETELSEASISRIRKGAQNISRDVIRRIVAATDGIVTADDLVFQQREAA